MNLPCLPATVAAQDPPLDSAVWWQRYTALVRAGYPPGPADTAARGAVPVKRLLVVEREEVCDGE